MILTGDSAGANLILALLSHISHPHPSTSTPIPQVCLPCKFHGIVLLSPWVSFTTGTPAYTANALKDCIPTSGIERWSEAFMGTPAPHTENSDHYNQAATAPSEWWADISANEILIVAGEDEVLLDGIKEFAARLEKVKKEILTVVITKGEAHDQPVLDLQMGYKNLGEQARVIRGWVSVRL
jgi:acetyl esterase/lipase